MQPLDPSKRVLAPDARTPKDASFLQKRHRIMPKWEMLRVPARYLTVKLSGRVMTPIRAAGAHWFPACGAQPRTRHATLRRLLGIMW